jgi:hypothetical protein
LDALGVKSAKPRILRGETSASSFHPRERKLCDGAVLFALTLFKGKLVFFPMADASSIGTLPGLNVEPAARRATAGTIGTLFL